MQDWPVLQLKVASGLTSYRLLDSGDGMKLEQWGEFRIARPDGQVIWPRLYASEWERPDAIFLKEGTSGGWKISHPALKGSFPWSWGKLRFDLELTPFKHTGVFPEQSANWLWIQENVRAFRRANRRVQVLNLFAYTGGATLAAAGAGADETVHVDASKPALEWARQNMLASGLAESRIRFMLDDVGKFVERESRRSRRYQGIIMDPPVYGRGPKGEKWEIEKDLGDLFRKVWSLLDPEGGFMLVNAYTTGLSALGLANLFTASCGQKGHLEVGELGLPHAKDRRILPTGIYGRYCVGVPTLA